MLSWRNDYWTEVWGCVRIEINYMEGILVIGKEGYRKKEEHIQSLWKKISLRNYEFSVS